MGINQTKYGVQNRLASLENAVTELKKENAELRTHLLTELKNAVSDTVGQTGATGRDGAAVIGPVGPAGKDSNVQGPRGAEGRRGDTGPRGERGETGEQGIQGLPGKDGVDGQSIGLGLLDVESEGADALRAVDEEKDPALVKEP